MLPHFVHGAEEEIVGRSFHPDPLLIRKFPIESRKETVTGFGHGLDGQG